MTDFDVSNPHYRRYADVENRIGNAWLAQVRGSAYHSRLIMYGTGGPHSHSAMLCRTNGHVDMMELLEFKGGRRVPLESQVHRLPGRIDIFSVDLERFPELDTAVAAKEMRTLTGMDYGTLGVLRLALRKVPLLWRLWPLDTNDVYDIDTIGAPFCSHAVALSFRKGGVDPVPRKPDHLVSPNDLTWSLLFRYEFTLIP